jgi:hypothetical protein
MAIIAPAQSSLRVMPTAAVAQPELFLQQPSPAAGMQLFEQAAKLPLLMEQIKMEKVRQKAEKAKLDLAELQAQYQTENFQRLADVQQRQAEADIFFKQSQAAAQQAAARAALADVTIVSPTAASPAPAGPAPLADAVVAPAPLAEGAAPSPAAVPAPAVTAKDKAVVELVASLPQIPAGTDKQAAYDQIAQQQVDRQLQRRYGAGVPLKTYRTTVVEDRAKLAEEYRPKEGIYEFQSSTGLPMRVKAIKIGSQPVELLEEPVVDLEAFYKRNPMQKKIDDIVAEDVGPMLSGDADRKLESNLKNLEYAKGILADSSVATGSFVSMLPDAVRSRIPGLQRGISARDAVRNVVQQTLRETLGAQFARIEGEMMMERAFDARMPESENIRRINLLADEVVNYAKAKSAAAEYLKQNGTMFGYAGAINFDALADSMKARLDAAYGAATPAAGAAKAPPSTAAQAAPLAAEYAKRKRG